MTHQPFPRRALRQLQGLVVVTAVILVLGLIVSPDRAWSNLLLGTFYLLSIGLGGAVFLALTRVSGASWQLPFRRVPEAMAGMIPFAGAAIVVVLGMRMTEYGWHHHGDHGAGTFWFKELWLTPSVWFLRSLGYVLIWSLAAGLLVARLRKRDTDDSRSNQGNLLLSALFLVVYAVTFSLASVDWIMSLEPMWFSTMWGVYHFAGMFQAALAVVVILGLTLRSPGGPLRGIFNDEHLHDLGRLLLGFSCFWMYIWFSQYMLIWYSNIPEETSYFIARTHGPWGALVIGAIVLNWLIPFFVLLPRPAKRSQSIMMKIAIVVLLGRWVDLYVMIFPATVGDQPVFGLWEVASIGCLIGCFCLLLLRSLSRERGAWALLPVARSDDGQERPSYDL